MSGFCPDCGHDTWPNGCACERRRESLPSQPEAMPPNATEAVDPGLMKPAASLPSEIEEAIRAFGAAQRGPARLRPATGPVNSEVHAPDADAGACSSADVSTTRGDRMPYDAEKGCYRTSNPPTREEHIDMMSHPRYWPQCPILPLKKRRADGGFPDDAFMLAIVPGEDTLVIDPDVPPLPVIYKANVYMVPKDLTSVKQEYASIEAIVDDGWEVD